MKTGLLAAVAAAIIGLSVVSGAPSFAQVSAEQRDSVNNGVSMLGGVEIADIAALSDDQILNIQLVLDGTDTDEVKRDRIKEILGQ
jgi:hypothetical protein